MQALRVQTATSDPKVEEVPIPKIGPNDVLIKVYAAALTGGVMKLIRRGQSHVPSIVGHEAAGIIATLGDDVKENATLTVGARVRLHPMLSCRQCARCSSGQDSLCDQSSMMGFARLQDPCPLYEEYHDGTVAEYVRAPHWLVDPLPDNVSMEVGAKVHDIATALRVLELADLPSEATIVLTAPTGAMGALTLRLAKFFPTIKKIVLAGRSRERMESVRRLTPTRTEVVQLVSDGEDSDPPKTGALVGQLKALCPEGIDAILDYVPTGSALLQVLPALKTGGTLVHMGGNVKPLALPQVFIMARCWRIVGTRANSRPDTVRVLKWLAEGQLEIEDLITHRFTMADASKNVEILDSRREPVWLSVIDPTTKGSN